jgi:ABC-2 type transport system permease protein
MQMNLQRLGALIRREVIQLLRDRWLLLFVLGIPILELVLYGYAAHLTVTHIPLAVLDQSHDRPSREFVQAMVNSQYFDWTLEAHSQGQVMEAINRGDVKVGLVIPPGFAANLEKKTAHVLVLLDGSDTASVQSGYSAAALVAQNSATQIVAQNVIRSSPVSQNGLPIVASTQILYNPDLIDIWFILPGLVGLILQTLAIQQAALIVVKERELGTIETILATPARPLELMVSKVVPLLALCLVATGIVVALGIAWFGVPFRGSLLLYFWLSLLFIASSLGLGLFLSTQAKTQMEASVTGLMFMMIGMLMSGFMYPVSAMPVVFQLISDLFPVTYFIRISRAIFLKGVGLDFVWSDALILAVYCVVIVVIAARSFKPRLD